MTKGKFIHKLQNSDGSFVVKVFPETDLEYLKLEINGSNSTHYKKENVKKSLLEIIKVCRCALCSTENADANFKERVQSGCDSV